MDTRTKEEKKTHGINAHKDPLTDAPGAHPVGTALGAAGAGAVGAGIGAAVGGPIGSLAGAAIGAVAGGLAGKGVAEAIDPTVEAAYWRANYAKRPYYDKTIVYTEYEPAYRYGWESRSRYLDEDWDDIESDLERGWGSSRAGSSLDWQKARPAVQDAWNRIPRRDV